MAQYRFAGFWIRVAAVLIDGIAIAVITLVLAFIMKILISILPYTLTETLHIIADTDEYQGSVFMLIYDVFSIFIGLAYYIYLHGSRYQATLGKRLVGVYVVDAQGNRISYLRSFGRYLSYFPSTIILGIGYMMAGWTEKKRALHDMIAGTYVVYGTPENPLAVLSNEEQAKSGVGES